MQEQLPRGSQLPTLFHTRSLAKIVYFSKKRSLINAGKNAHRLFCLCNDSCVDGGFNREVRGFFSFIANSPFHPCSIIL